MNKDKGDFSRRRFLGTGAAAAAFTIVPRHVLGGAGFVPPSEKLNIAGIGIGGRFFAYKIAGNIFILKTDFIPFIGANAVAVGSAVRVVVVGPALLFEVGAIKGLRALWWYG